MMPVTQMLCALMLSWVTAAGTYDPLERPAEARAKTVELVVHDAARERDIPVLVYLPPAGASAAVVLFSHGLGGSRHGATYLGEHWSARGYVAVFVQHPGSDTDVWRDVPRAERLAALEQAASMENFLRRTQDIPAVLDQLETWNDDPAHPLGGRMDLERVGMSGHSFGAVTTQAVSGQRYGRMGPRFSDKRIDAALAMSPSGPGKGTPAGAFGAVSIPWLLMTGTNDVSLIGTQTPETRLTVFAALPPSGEMYQLVLNGAEHSAFADRARPSDKKPHNPNHHQAILAISTAFWDAYLREDAAARAWLDGDGPRRVLDEADLWEHK